MVLLHAAGGGRRWLKVSKFFSLLWGLSGVTEGKAPLPRIAAFAASGRRAATTASLASATAPATRQRHDAFFLDLTLFGNPILAPAIEPETRKLFRLLVCRWIDSEAVFGAWVCDGPHNFWHAKFLTRRTPAGLLVEIVTLDSVGISFQLFALLLDSLPAHGWRGRVQGEHFSSIRRTPAGC